MASDADLLDRVLTPPAAPAPAAPVPDDPLLDRVLSASGEPLGSTQASRGAAVPRKSQVRFRWDERAAPSNASGNGWLRSLGLGARAAVQGVGSLPALAYDVAAIPQNLINAGVKAATGRDLGLSTRSGGEQLGGLLDATGLPRPETLGEQRAARVIEGAAGVIPTMGAGLAVQGARAGGAMGARMADMLLAKPATQLASGAGAGGAAQLADENGAGPVGQLAAGLVGGVGGAAVPEALGMGTRLAGALVQPFGQAGREAIVRDTMLRQSSDPAGLPGRLMASKLDPSLRLPDSPATTAQASRDPGLAMLESGLRSDMTSPSIGVPSPASRFAELDVRRNAARSEELPPPVPEAAAKQGSALREGLETARTDRNAEVGTAYGAVDPDGTSRVPIGGVRTAMDDLSARFYGPMSGGLPRELGALASDLNTANVVPYSQVQALYARVVRLQNELGSDPRAQSLLIGLKKSLDEAAEAAARPREPASVPASQGDILSGQAAEGAAQRPDVVQALAEQRGPAPEAAPWDRSSARAQNANGTEESLASFVIRHGGVQDDGGEIMQALGGSTRTRPGLLSSRGLPLDRMRELAHQEGYIGRYGQDSQGAFGSTTDDFVTALQDELNSQRTAAGPRDSSLGAAVDRELSERGLSLSDPAPDVLRGVREQAEGPGPGQAAPDGFAPVEDAFTPEQAARWRAAQELRRQFGQDFQRDGTGTGAVSTVLQRGQGGGFNVPDQAVASHALSSPNAARQVLAASGDAALPMLRQAFMDRAFKAANTAGVTAADGQPLLRAPGFSKYWDANKDLAAVIFPPDHLDRLRLLAADFSETASTAAMSRARGSDTARNLSVANVISSVSRGLIDPGNPLAQTVLRPLGVLTKIPEAGIRQLLSEAMADPELAARLLARASPDNVAVATGYIAKSMGQRIGEAAGNAAGRTALRAGAAVQPPALSLPPPEPGSLPPSAAADPAQRRRDAMARRLRV